MCVQSRREKLGVTGLIKNSEEKEIEVSLSINLFASRRVLISEFREFFLRFGKHKKICRQKL